jgi:hypothetical protein
MKAEILELLTEQMEPVMKIKPGTKEAKESEVSGGGISNV